ncbi:hypothetical protein C8Q70DRAFT_952852 [Cubamyces menziesii]|nr:hypothetical protein C8Q70DRAFT_952852 [Cubamyces menziesii]
MLTMKALGLPGELRPLRGCMVDATRVSARRRRIPSDCRNIHGDPPSASVFPSDQFPVKLTRNLRTLDRFKLNRQDYVDLSNRIIAFSSGQSSENKQSEPTEPSPDEANPNAPPEPPTHAIIGYREKRHTLGRSRITEYFPFPTNTHGFFYYLPQPSTPISGQIRFRLIEKVKGGPRTGNNLLNEYGLPWNIPLLTVAHSKRFKALSDVLQRDGFLTDELLESCKVMQESIGDVKLGPSSQIVTAMGHPFYVNLSDPAAYFFIVSRNSLYRLHNRYIFKPLDDPARGFWPFEEGVLRCQMVALYATPNDNLYPEIGVRVLRIIEPVRKKKDIPSHVPVVDIQPGSMVKLDGKPLPISWRNRTDVKFALLWRRRQKKRADRERAAGEDHQGQAVGEETQELAVNESTQAPQNSD